MSEKGSDGLNIGNPHESPSTCSIQAADPIDPLDKALRRIRRTKDFPTVSKYVIEINQKLSDHAIHSSASELANIILKDYALTNKLITDLDHKYLSMLRNQLILAIKMGR